MSVSQTVGPRNVISKIRKRYPHNSVNLNLKRGGHRSVTQSEPMFNLSLRYKFLRLRKFKLTDHEKWRPSVRDVINGENSLRSA